ncbi:4'-phosphopantetheinyl transferase superfamily protein [Mammaliicoccus sp. P-M59]|uniref:4'-phosphopantetheinyl transferase family protein n=1 Tax=Mammaliicoccus sp. P-M59 TaxID=2898718 RepID=UPI001EFAD417
MNLGQCEYPYRKLFRPHVLVVYTHLSYLPKISYDKLSLHFTTFEKEKLNLYKDERAKYEYAYSHFLLREIIKNEFHMSYDILTFNFPERDKPFSDKLNFNLSHSHGYLAFIFSRNLDVGIDVQKHVYLSENDLLSITETLFSERDYKLIEIASNKLEEFYKIWTQKESYGKAIGKGLLYPTKNVFVDSIQNIVIDLNHHQPLGWNCETVHIRKEATVSFAYQKTRKEDV